MRRLDKGKEARRRARKQAEKPGATRVIPNKRKEDEEDSCSYCAIRGCEGQCQEEPTQ